MSFCSGATSSDYECSTDVTSKQTAGCHDSSVDASDGPMQKVERVACSDVTSPETDAEGMDLHQWSALLVSESPMCRSLMSTLITEVRSSKMGAFQRCVIVL